MKLMELHASHAHGEDPKAWTGEDRTYLKTLIKSEKRLIILEKVTVPKASPKINVVRMRLNAYTEEPRSNEKIRFQAT